MPTQRERTEASRRATIAAALQIIGDGGYRALTTAHVEEATGTSRGLVGYHFVSKQGLTEAVIRHVEDAFTNGIVGLHQPEWSSGMDGLMGVIRGYLGQLGRDPRFSRVMLILITESIAGQPQLRPAIQALNAVLRDSLRDQLLRGQADGSVREDVDAIAESVVLAGVLRGVTLQWLADPDRVDLNRATESAAAMARRAYGDY